jgi:hypothetical protein
MQQRSTPVPVGTFLEYRTNTGTGGDWCPPVSPIKLFGLEYRIQYRCEYRYRCRALGCHRASECVAATETPIPQLPSVRHSYSFAMYACRSPCTRQHGLIVHSRVLTYLTRLQQRPGMLWSNETCSRSRPRSCMHRQAAATRQLGRAQMPSAAASSRASHRKRPRCHLCHGPRTRPQPSISRQIVTKRAPPTNTLAALQRECHLDEDCASEKQSAKSARARFQAAATSADTIKHTRRVQSTVRNGKQPYITPQTPMLSPLLQPTNEATALR